MENTLQVSVYVLITSHIDGSGTVRDRIVGVTFDLGEAEAHKAKGVEHEFETHKVEGNWQADAETSMIIEAMRDFRGVVNQLQEEASH